MLKQLVGVGLNAHRGRSTGNCGSEWPDTPKAAITHVRPVGLGWAALPLALGHQ